RRTNSWKKHGSSSRRTKTRLFFFTSRLHCHTRTMKPNISTGPVWKSRTRDAIATGHGPKQKEHAAMISYLDEGVGTILATLQKLGIDENTLVIFTSD